VAEESSNFRLSFWKKFIPNKPLLYIDNSDIGYLDDNSENIHEEIYSWQTVEYVFNGIEDEHTRTKIYLKLREPLFKHFTEIP